MAKLSVSKLLSRLPPEATDEWALAKELKADSDGLLLFFDPEDDDIDVTDDDDAAPAVAANDGVESHEHFLEGLPPSLSEDILRTSEVEPNFG